MANAQPSPRVLNEFVQNLLDDLSSGRITPDAAMVASLQYPYLRALISEHRDEIAGALQDEGKLRVVLEGTLRAAAALVNKELPQFQVEKPDGQLPPGDIVARARSFRAARLEVVTATGQQRGKVGQLRKAFINRLVQNWVAQTRTIIDKEKQQQAADALIIELEQELPGVVSFEELSARVQRALKNTRVEERVAGAIRREMAPVQQELAIATQKLAGIATIPMELIAHLATPRPDRFAVIAIQTISSTTLSPTAALARAASLDRTAEALSSPLPKEKDVAAAGVFFRALASTATQKAFAAVADALLSQLSPFARQEVIKATFSRALEGALVKTDVLTKRLGQGFVESEFFRLVIDSARKEFAHDAGAGAGVKQARGAIDDIIGSLLRGHLVAPLIGNPKEMILSYLELLVVEAKLPRDKKTLFPEHSPAVAALSLLLKDQPADARITILKDAGFASLGALQTAASQLSQRFPSWQMFYVMMLASAAPTAYASFVAPAFTSPFSSTLGSVGGALGRVGRGLSDVALGLGGGLVGVVFGGGLGALFNRLRGPREPDRFFDDTPKFIAVGVVIVIVLLFVFPSFFNSPLTSRAAKYAALLVNSQSIYAGGPYTETFPEYNGPFPSGSTGVSTCAVDHKNLTQRPFDSGGIGTHSNTCAYDFNATSMSSVVATHDGCVAFARTDIKNNKRDEGSYGNVVILAGKNPDGSVFYSRYAHLAQNTSSHLSRGQCITAGTPIGNVDNTGNSTGTHLHLEFLDENMGYITPEQCFSAYSLPGCIE